MNQNITTIEKVYDAFNAREYEQVLAQFDPAFEWIAADNSPLADKSPYRGIAAIREGVFDRIAAGFEKLIVIPDEIFGADGHVVVLGYYEGKFRGSQEEFRTQVAHIWTLVDGKPVKFQQYVDTLKIALDSGSVAVKAAAQT
jgi:ketosteroid isomerase-like protein